MYEIFFLVYEIIAIIIVFKWFVAFVFVVYEIVYDSMFSCLNIVVSQKN